MNLHLFDTSEYIYSGSRNLWILRGGMQTDSGYVDASLPCGSLAYVLNTFEEWGGENEVLVHCIDSPPTYKRALHEKYFSGGYKGNRSTPTPEITVQKKMVPEMLEMIGANTVTAPGYEADDIIASIVKYYHDDFEKIYIHAADSDLFYLVDEKVEILPLAGGFDSLQKNYSNNKKISPGRHIYLENWTSFVRKGKTCPRNVLTLFKILDGERGDNVPAVSYEMGMKIVDSIPHSEYPLCGDNEYLREKIKIAVNNDEMVMAVTDLIMPVILPFKDVEIFESDLDMTKFMNMAALCKCKYAHSWKYTANEECEAFINKYLQIYLND